MELSRLSVRPDRILLVALGALGLYLTPRALCFVWSGGGSWRSGRCVNMTIRAMRSEAWENVEGIRTAQLAYAAAFDQYVDCREPTPRPVAALTRKPSPWVNRPCWEALGWKPDGDVRGTYWIEVGGGSFTVHGLLDADQNGVPAHVTVSATGERVWVDPDEI